jgi:GNAT superfamily N-acetyltransferase
MNGTTDNSMIGMEPTTASAEAAVVRLRVCELEHPEANDQVVALLADLRPGTADLVGAIAVAATRGVRYLGAYERAGRLAAVAGWRVMASTRGRVLYVDDLVTDPARRGMGAGGALLAWLERAGVAERCRALELDSGVTRSDAHRFYARVGLSISAFHFAKPLGAAMDVRETRGARS